MKRQRVFTSIFRWSLTACFLAISGALSASPPPLMLSTVYQDGVAVHEYWVSEKLDGVRAYWDGRKLISRKGMTYKAPDWFVAKLPSVALDGELWLGRNRFDELSGIVRRQAPEDDVWRQVRFMLFDMPQLDAPFGQRLVRLRKLAADLQIPWVEVVPQQRVNDRSQLESMLKRVVRQGGEGVMLHHQDARYRSGRSHDLLKYKPYQDAEARVIAHLPGKGKNRGFMGSLLVETPAGIQFKIGTGFSAQERREPPSIGMVVTYRFHGLTRNGVPRFASYIRVRN